MTSRISSRFDRKIIYHGINLDNYKITISDGDNEKIVPFSELYFSHAKGSIRYKISSRKICGTNRAESIHGLEKALRNIRTPNPEKIKTIVYERQHGKISD